MQESAAPGAAEGVEGGGRERGEEGRQVVRCVIAQGLNITVGCFTRLTRVTAGMDSCTGTPQLEMPAAYTAGHHSRTLQPHMQLNMKVNRQRSRWRNKLANHRLWMVAP